MIITITVDLMRRFELDKKTAAEKMVITEHILEFSSNSFNFLLMKGAYFLVKNKLKNAKNIK